MFEEEKFFENVLSRTYVECEYKFFIVMIAFV